MRIKRILLKYERDVAFGRHFVRYNASLDRYVAPIGSLQTGDQTQRRGLSSTRRAKQHDKLAVRDRERKGTHRLDCAETLADSCQCHLSHGLLLHKGPPTAPVPSSPRTNRASR